MMMSCKEAARLVSEGLDRKLPWKKRMELRLHLMMCKACVCYRKQLIGLFTMMRLNTDGLESMDDDRHKLSACCKDRIKKCIKDKQDKDDKPAPPDQD